MTRGRGNSTTRMAPPASMRGRPARDVSSTGAEEPASTQRSFSARSLASFPEREASGISMPSSISHKRSDMLSSVDVSFFCEADVTEAGLLFCSVYIFLILF